MKVACHSSQQYHPIIRTVAASNYLLNNLCAKMIVWDSLSGSQTIAGAYGKIVFCQQPGKNLLSANLAENFIFVKKRTALLK